MPPSNHPSERLEWLSLMRGLSIVLVVVSACMMVVNLCFRRHDPADLLVNQVAAREAAALEEAPEGEAAPEELEILDTAERRTDEQEETDDGSEN